MRTFETGRLLMVLAACGGLALVPNALAAPPAASEFQAMDANHDGKIGRDEHAVAAKRMFDAMDTDKDGALTEAELAAGHAKMLRK